MIWGAFLGVLTLLGVFSGGWGCDSVLCAGPNPAEAGLHDRCGRHHRLPVHVHPGMDHLDPPAGHVCLRPLRRPHPLRAPQTAGGPRN